MMNMKTAWIAGVGAVLMAAALSSPTFARDSAVEVTRYGFCLSENEGRCFEVALPGANIDFERLPVHEDGRRYISFYSAQRAKPGAVIIHLLNGEDLEPYVTYKLPELAQKPPKGLQKKLESIVKKNSALGAVVIAATVVPKVDDGDYYFFSRIFVPSPGFFSGKILDINGKAIPGTEPVTFGVMRRPPD